MTEEAEKDRTASRSWVYRVSCPKCDAPARKPCTGKKPWHEGPIRHKARLFLAMQLEAYL